MEDKFISGLFTARRENAPEFLLASLSFKTETFIDWLKGHTNSKGYCNCDVLKSKDGKPYTKHNDWQPNEHFVKDENGKVAVEELGEEIDSSDIPF